LEAKLYELVRGLNQTEGVRLQADFVSNDLEFYEIGLKQLACHACRFYSFLRGHTASGVWEKRPFGFAQ
jgi:hypothetical protein